MGACIEAEVIAQSFLQSHAEESVVLQTSAAVMVCGSLEDDIVRVALKGGLVRCDADIAKSLPTHQGIRKLERAVLDHLGIQASVSSEVDVLEEDAIHGRLNLSHRLLGLNGKLVLCRGRECGHAAQG